MPKKFAKLVTVNTDPDQLSETIRRALAPVRYDCLPSSREFHHKIDLGTVGETHVWTSSSRTGYTVLSEDTLKGYLEIHSVDAGQYHSTTDTQDVDAKAGQAYLLLNPGGHHIQCQPQTIQSSIAIPIRKYLQLLEPNVSDPIASISSLTSILDCNHPAVRLIFEIGKFLQASHDPESALPASPMTADLLEQALLQALIDAWPRQGLESRLRPTPHPRSFRRAIEWIREHLGEKITLEQITSASGTGARAIQILFKKELGLSPIQYVIIQRLQAVHRELLDKRDHKTIAGIAASYGFHHTGEFVRRYKEYYGRTPSETRRSARILR